MKTPLSKPEYAHLIADTCYEEDDWKVMHGPIPGNADKTHAFIHHDCEKLDHQNRPLWKSWYATRKKEMSKWCNYCGSEPSDELQALSIMMEME